MSDEDNRPGQAADLRRRAEAAFSNQETPSPEDVGNLSPEEVRRMLHELRVHQIELQMQNEELRSAQVALDTERARYFDLYDLAPAGYVTVSDKGLILEANLTAATLLGVVRGALIRQSLSRFVSRESQNTDYQHRKELFENGQTQTWKQRMTNAAGKPFWALLVATAAQDDAGTPVCRIVLNDVSQSKSLEDEHERLTRERARLEDQLRQSQKVEAIGRLAGGVAHDFNNITAIILGYAELLLARLGPEDPARNHVEQIEAAGRRSAALTRQLLAFSRKQTLQLEVLDLNALVRNFLPLLGRLIGEDVQLDSKLTAEPGHIIADAAQLEQVITNLALNARDAMPGGGKLTVETTVVELDALFAPGHEGVVPGRYVFLALTDSGCGMDEAALGHLFEPFYTTKEKSKGPGLGLATAYGIVKQSGGYIWASSKPGVGTTFRIYLPWTDAHLSALVAEQTGELPRGGGELILLVEDEAPLRELCETVLVKLGFRVSTAANGQEALRLVSEQGLEPDLVLTDVIMPVMSGSEMARRLESERPGLKVLYMSGYPDEAVAPHGILEQGIHFIQKPFTERSLAAKISQALAARSALTARAGRRVLMIDDDEQYRELVQHFCTKHGHAFTGADGAEAAIKALAGQCFDVLLVDLNIPGTSGAQVLREIRATGNNTLAIVLTGDVASADMDVLRPLGVVRVVEKSSNAKPLLQAIEAVALGVRPRENGAT